MPNDSTHEEEPPARQEEWLLCVVLALALLFAFLNVRSVRAQEDTPTPEVVHEIAKVAIEVIGRERLRGISAPKAEGGYYRAAIDFDASDNLTGSFIRGGIVSDAQLIIQGLSEGAAYDSVHAYSLVPFFELTDQYGNVSEEPVGRIDLSREVARKINWENMARQRFEALLEAEGNLSFHSALQ